MRIVQQIRIVPIRDPQSVKVVIQASQQSLEVFTASNVFPELFLHLLVNVNRALLAKYLQVPVPRNVHYVMLGTFFKLSPYLTRKHPQNNADTIRSRETVFVDTVLVVE